jgi:TolB-like protein
MAGLVFLSGCSATRKGMPESGSALPQNLSNSSVYNRPIAVLPVENLSGTAAPLEEIRKSLIKGLVERGFQVLDEKILEEFMARHRMRYIGGIDGATAKAFKEETGAGSILITSLELYNDMNPPKIALISRLVSPKESPVILWMDSVGLAGDDAPGFLDLGLIVNPIVLRDKALRSLSTSLAGNLAERWVGESPEGRGKKFRPKIAYRSPAFDPEARHTVAVVPFFNESTRKYAGEIMQLHLVQEMAKVEKIKVIEPGVVRNEFLALRIIMEEGISLAQSDLVWDALDADLLLSGKVYDYQDYQGTEGAPIVDFSLQVIERKGREVGWASKSYNKGTDGVWFFDLGRERTASAMAAEMARIVRGMMWK